MVVAVSTVFIRHQAEPCDAAHAQIHKIACAVCDLLFINQGFLFAVAHGGVDAVDGVCGIAAHLVVDAGDCLEARIFAVQVVNRFAVRVQAQALFIHDPAHGDGVALDGLVDAGGLSFPALGDRLCRFEVRDIDGVRGVAIVGGLVRCALRVDAVDRGLVQEGVLPFGDIGEGDLDKAGANAAEILFVGAVRNRIRCVGGNLRPGAGFVGGDLYFIGIGGAFEVQFELIHVQGIFGILHPVFVRAGVFRHPLGGEVAVVGHSAVAAGGEGGMAGLVRPIIPRVEQLIRGILFFFNQEIVRLGPAVFRLGGGGGDGDLRRFHAGRGGLNDGGAGIVGAEFRCALAVAHQVAAGQGHDLSGGEYAGAVDDFQRHGGGLVDPIAVFILDRDDQVGVRRAVVWNRILGDGELQMVARAFLGEFRRDAGIGLPVPVPRLERQAAVVDEAHLRQAGTAHAAVLERAPERDTGAVALERIVIDVAAVLHIAEIRAELIGGAAPVGRVRTVFRRDARHVFGHMAGHPLALFRELGGTAVAVVACHVADVQGVKALALHAAHARLAGGVQQVGQVAHFVDQILADLHIGLAHGEEQLVAHAPDDDGRMVAVDADHVRKLPQAGLVKRLVVLRVGRVAVDIVPVRSGVGGGAVCAAAHGPEGDLRPEHDAQLIAGFCIGGVVGIMGTADKVHARVLNHLHVAP